MTEDLNRRNFLKKSMLMSAGITAGLSLEEKALLAFDPENQNNPNCIFYLPSTSKYSL